MRSAIFKWLDELEDMFRGMISGTIDYLFRELPESIYRFLFETLGPTAVRLVRVSVVFSIWLALVFGPAATASKLGLSFWWMTTALTWMVLAMIGSAWGRRRFVKRRLAGEDLVTQGSGRVVTN